MGLELSHMHSWNGWRARVQGMEGDESEQEKCMQSNVPRVGGLLELDGFNACGDNVVA